MEYDGVKDTNVILDDIYEAMDENEYGCSFYPARDDMPDAELYLTYGGMCYRVTVIPHSHPKEEI